jgi:hypothetical protein
MALIDQDPSGGLRRTAALDQPHCLVEIHIRLGELLGDTYGTTSAKEDVQTPGDNIILGGGGENLGHLTLLLLQADLERAGRSGSA